ncbi:hypothetical protein [Trinickia diaoshuihuensis]|uniref:hypothetical protein n=1 Tax=Trinickia diaoshuihuensis TaxID=2292265 RepID=UPI000E22A365|nr:hypothetical protein [Trinickia diaoshuihuensis]
MALKKSGTYRVGRRFSVSAASGKVVLRGEKGEEPLHEVAFIKTVPGKIVGTAVLPDVPGSRGHEVTIIKNTPLKIVGTAVLPDTPVSRGYGVYVSPGFRAAKLRSKMDQAMRESEEAREEATGSGDMVVIGG